MACSPTTTPTSQFSERRKRSAAINADYALGADVEAGADIEGVDTLKLAGHYRFDEHGAWQEYTAAYLRRVGRLAKGANVVCFTQPTVYAQKRHIHWR